MITVDTILPEQRKGAGWRGIVTHCRHGHEYTPRNTRTKNGTRSCAECNRQQALAYYRAKRGPA